MKYRAPGTGWEGRVSWEHTGFLSASPVCRVQGAGCKVQVQGARCRVHLLSVVGCRVQFGVCAVCSV